MGNIKITPRGRRFLKESETAYKVAYAMVAGRSEAPRGSSITVKTPEGKVVVVKRAGPSGDKYR